MKRILATVALLALLAGTVAARQVVTVREYTEGKANADSFAAAVDTLNAIEIPDNRLVGMWVGVTADTAAVEFTGQVSLDGGTTWRTVFVDTAAANSYEEHELGLATDGTGVRGPYYGLLPGKHFRVICDNLGATIQASEVFLKFEKEN